MKDISGHPLVQVVMRRRAEDSAPRPSNIIRFPKAFRPPPTFGTPPRGFVYLWPCPDEGGSWGVIHENEAGDEISQLSSWFHFDDAERAARTEAARLNARLVGDAGDPTPPTGGPSA